MKTNDRSACPLCEKTLDAASAVSDGDAHPADGDLTFCVYCGAPLVFRADLTVRLPTLAELAKAPPALTRARALVRALRQTLERYRGSR